MVGKLAPPGDTIERPSLWAATGNAALRQITLTAYFFISAALFCKKKRLYGV